MGGTARLRIHTYIHTYIYIYICIYIYIYIYKYSKVEGWGVGFRGFGITVELGRDGLRGCAREEPARGSDLKSDPSILARRAKPLKILST